MIRVSADNEKGNHNINFRQSQNSFAWLINSDIDPQTNDNDCLGEMACARRLMIANTYDYIMYDFGQCHMGIKSIFDKNINVILHYIGH